MVALDHRNPEVASAIRAVMLASYRVEAEILGVKDFFPLHRTAGQIAGADAAFFAIREGAALAAVAEVEEETADQVLIAALVVDPRSFRRGYGSALVHHVIATFGGRAVRVSTGVRNVPAIRLYESLGFRETRHWSTPDGIPMTTLLRRD